MSAPVVIAGAGIAGSALALGLQRAGVPAMVCEAHPDDGADAGAFLTLAANGVRALRALDAADAVAAVSSPMGSMRVLDAAGTELAQRPLGGPDEDVAFRLLTRAVLARTLRTLAIERGVEVRHGARVVGTTPHDGGVTVHLADGDDVPGALLVGADGLHSPVRALIDPQAAPPRPVGQRIYYGFSPRPISAHPGDFHVVRHDAAAFGAVTAPDGGSWWFARVDIDVPPPPPDADPAGSLRAALGTGVAADVVAATGRVFVTDACDLPYLGHWYRDRMLVVGDAAHAASPATGQGASMACEDAVVLAKALRDEPDPPVAAARYERARRGRTQANIIASAGMSGRPPAGADPGEPLPDPLLHAQLDWTAPVP